MDEAWAARYPEFERAHFWWRTRRDVVTRLIAGHAKGRRLRVLDIGCGSGVLLEELSFEHETLGLEPDSDLATASAVRERIRVGGVETVDYPSESFDVILMLDVLEHLDDPIDALGRARKWIATDGLLIVLVPAHASLWTTHDEINDHRCRYTRRQLRAELEASGWRARTIHYLFATLVPPKLIQVGLDKLIRNRKGTAPDMPPRWLNSLAAQVLRADAAVAQSRIGPVWPGTSVLAVVDPAPSAL
jgi:SAM-dependent methyltransferase